MTVTEKTSLREKLEKLLTGNTASAENARKVQELIDRPTYAHRAGERVKLTVAEAYRLGRKLKPRHLKHALWRHIFKKEEAVDPRLGEACHLGALAVGAGMWDETSNSSTWWPDGVPDPSVELPCDEHRGQYQQLQSAIVHMADQHGTSGKYPSSWVADWLDRVAPRQQFDTNWIWKDDVVDD